MTLRGLLLYGLPVYGIYLQKNNFEIPVLSCPTGTSARTHRYKKTGFVEQFGSYIFYTELIHVAKKNLNTLH